VFLVDYPQHRAHVFGYNFRPFTLHKMTDTFDDNAVVARTNVWWRTSLSRALRRTVQVRRMPGSELPVKDPIFYLRGKILAGKQSPDRQQCSRSDLNPAVNILVSYARSSRKTAR